jgi:hypothetical protein
MVYKIITELRGTRSRNEKEAILKREVDNEDLQTFFHLALSPFINFYQKKSFTQTKTIGNGKLAYGMADLEHTIAGRKITGNNAIDYINDMINSLSEDDAKVIMHILQKESGCDLGASTINKIWPKLIPTWPCLLATAYDDKLAAKLNWTKGVFSQLKSDGGRVNIVVDLEGGVKLFSRAGNELNVSGAFDHLCEQFKGFVLDGEMLAVLPNGKFADRQTGNGLFNKCVRGTLSEDESKTLHIMVWDLIPINDFMNESSQVEYSSRFAQLCNMVVDGAPEKISIIPSRIVHSIAQAQEHYQEMLAAGEEGTMLKDLDMLWEDKRSKKQLKLKAENTGEFKIIGHKDGVGELVGNLGSLVIATSDEKLIANMSGFTLKFRSEIYANIINAPVRYVMVVDDCEKEFFAMPGDTDVKMDSIIECMYNQKIKGRDKETWSVFLPRFHKVRLDKLTANTLEELK